MLRHLDLWVTLCDSADLPSTHCKSYTFPCPPVSVDKSVIVGHVTLDCLRNARLHVAWILLSLPINYSLPASCLLHSHFYLVKLVVFNWAVRIFCFNYYESQFTLWKLRVEVENLKLLMNWTEVLLKAVAFFAWDVHIMWPAINLFSHILLNYL